jgi:tetratricopeptide (TPR) repeat protein
MTSRMTPLFALAFFLAAATISCGSRADAQEVKARADDVEALRKQIEALKKEVETLKLQLAEERKRADAQRAEAAQERARAEANFRRAREAVDRLLAERAAAQAAEQKQLENARAQLLEQALKFYRELLEKKDGGEVNRQQQALALQRIGHIRAQMGKPAECEKAYRQAIQLSDGLVREFPNNAAYRRDLARAYNGLAHVLRAAGQTSEANEAAERAKALGDAPK